MANSIRTPRQGRTANQQRIAEAVDNEGWQMFRVSLKGTPTKDKLDSLKRYYTANVLDGFKENSNEDVVIRIDNYIKALCRGGQLDAGMAFADFLDGSLWEHIKK